jgi:hypothetical protein
MAKVDFGNLGDLSKPAQSLVNRISEGVSGIARPWQIKRVAMAEGEAAIIKAKSAVEVSAIEQRALLRVIHEEVRNQEAIETITAKAIPHLKENADAHSISKDWMAYFFERCKLVTDDLMQEHWARILAEEANHPKSISRRAIQVMSQLEKNEAELFSRLRKYAVSVENKLETIVWNRLGVEPPFEDVNFENFLHLQAIGLITFDTTGRFGISGLKSNEVINYFGQCYVLNGQTDEFLIDAGFVLLTEVGRQLMTFCEVSKSESFIESLLARLMQNGTSIHCEIKDTRFEP